ncbi:MAG: hypothetical protein HOM21_17035 [Halobacteriovoraceae bacterium]|nr:hypothetical protein [Halobacteriovoraceae bacterium]
MKKGPIFLLLFTWLCLAPTAFSKDTTKDRLGKIQNKTHYKKIPDASLTILGIELESTTFNQLHRLLGRTPLRFVIKDNTSFRESCYRGRDGTILQLLAPTKGEYREQVLVASLGISKYTEAPSGCASSVRLNKKAKYKSGLRLGMSYLELKKILGNPSFHHQDLLSYRFIHQFKKATRTHNEVVEFWPEFVDDKLVFLKVSKFIR